MSNLPTASLSDIWVQGTWNEYLTRIEKLDQEKTQGYYYNKYYKLEMSPIVNDHACDHTIIILNQALQQTRQTNHSLVGRWLMEEFNNPK